MTIETFGCCSVLLRASFLAVAVPLLLVGSILSEVALQLQIQSVKQLEYASAEGAAAAGLETDAQGHAAAAVEQQTEALELQAQAAQLQGVSIEEEQGLIELKAENAGFNPNALMEQDAANLKAAVQSAASSAAHRDNALQAAAEVATGDVEAVEESLAADAEATEAAEDTEIAVAEGATASTVEADAAAIGGPLALAIAAAGVSAVAEAPQAVAAVQGVSNEFQADSDELIAVEKEAQVGGLEADTIIEMDGSASAQSAAAKSVAVAAAYFTSAQVLQMLAFACEAPVALVVLAQWTFGAGATIYGVKQCNSAASSCGAASSVFTLAAALGSLLVGPWAKTVLYAAELANGDPNLKILSNLPHLVKNATENNHFSKSVLLDRHERKLQLNFDDLKKNVQKMAGSMEEQAKKQGGPTISVIATGVEKEAAHLSNETSQIAKGVEQDVQQKASEVAKNIEENVQKKAAEAAKTVQDDIPVVEEKGAEAVSGISKGVEQEAGQVRNITSQVQGNADVQRAEQTAAQLGNMASQELGKDTKKGSEAAGQAVGAVSNSIPEDVKKDAEAISNTAKSGTDQVVHGAQQVSGAAANAVSNQIPENVKSAAQAAAQNTEHAAADAAKRAEEEAIRYKNGIPDVHTTTVQPHKPPKHPSVMDPQSQLKPAIASVKNRLIHWVWPVLNSVLLISGLFVLTEICIATGRHLPAHQKGCVGMPAMVGRVLYDTYQQWMMGLALLIAAWIFSIIMAPALQSTAERAQDHVDNGSSTIAAVQMSLCTASVLACCGHATCMARLKCTCANCQGKDDAASKGEMTPLKAAAEDVSDGEPSSPKKSEGASVPTACWMITAVIDALLLACERPITAWALGNSYKSYFAFRIIIGLLPWSMMAPTVWGHTFSSPYELMLPVGFAAFMIGGMLVMAKRKGI